MFEKGQIYNRQNDLHDKYGGNRRSGISSCLNYPFIFLFTSTNGKTHGYRDGWLDKTTYLYSGEGQYGDMDLIRGNRAIKNHKQTDRHLHLFEKDSIGEYRYIGEFTYLGHKFISGEDTDKETRKMIIFTLQMIDEK